MKVVPIACQVAERITDEQQFAPDHLIQGQSKEIQNITVVDNKCRSAS